MIQIIRSLLSGNGLELQDIIQICVLVFIAVCCLPVHESAHAWMAERLGDPTGRLKGRISLNPFAHLSLIGTLMILIFGFGFAKPVPVNINNFPSEKRKKYFAFVALAGPVSNLFLAFVFSFFCSVLKFILTKNADPPVGILVSYYFFFYASYINVALAVFNLIPVPPLDGSRLLTAVLPDNMYYKIMAYERYSMIALFALIFLFNRINFSPISFLSKAVYNLISFITYLPFRFFA